MGPPGAGLIAPLETARAAETGARKPGRARPCGLAVDPAAVEQMGGELVPVDEDGTFSTKATGGQLLCRLRGTSRQAGAAGCVIVELPVQGGLRLIFREEGLRVEEG